MLSKPRKARNALSMTSLIDVIFLLLLFFMLTSTFTRFAEIPLSSGAAGLNATTPDSPPALVRLTSEGLSVNGIDTAPDGLLAAVDALPQAPNLLIVTLTEDVTSQQLVDLLVQVQPRPDLAIKVLE
ncbi:biopolymer transporter ExbD [Yoonia sp. BS5-3]|uniref:Biopolymer transporter ExbD n=1 Tax=Yoonia phaeophyticola TaxID=3137369 RepID=A0ABZ2V110_9RHOB